MRCNISEFANYSPCMVTIYGQDRNVLLREPSLLAVNARTGKTLAAGQDAQEMRVVESIIVGSPLKGGIIADFDLARGMFQAFLGKTIGRRQVFRPKIAVCAPIDMTSVERRVICELLYSIGAKSGSVLIIKESFNRAISVIPDSHKIIIEISPMPI